MSRRRLWCAAAVLVLAAGCGVPVDARPRPIPDDRVPFDLLDPDLRPPALTEPVGSAGRGVAPKGADL